MQHLNSREIFEFTLSLGFECYLQYHWKHFFKRVFANSPTTNRFESTYEVLDPISSPERSKGIVAEGKTSGNNGERGDDWSGMTEKEARAPREGKGDPAVRNSSRGAHGRHPRCDLESGMIYNSRGKLSHVRAVAKSRLWARVAIAGPYLSFRQ